MPINDYIKSIRLWGVLTSLFLSYLAYTFHDIIGRDSILYVQTAQVYLENGFKASQTVYSWPFHPIVFALIHKFSGFSLEISAQIFDAMLTALFVDSFYRLYRETVVDAKINWVPMVTILAFSGINDYRYEIVRDWGFWAFSLLAFVYLLRTFKAPSIKDAILWQCFITTAFFFRIEAIGFMVTSPLLLLFSSGDLRKRITNYLHANIIFLVGFMIALAMFLISDATLGQLGRINQLVDFLDLSHTTEVIAYHKKQIAEYVMRYHGHSLGGVFLFAGVFGVVLYKAIVKIGFFYNAILLLGLYKFSNKPSKTYFWFIGVLIVTTFFIVYFFVLHSMVLAGRYIVLIAVLSLIFVTFFFEKIIEYCMKTKKSMALNALKVAWLITLTTGIFHSSGSKDHLKKLGKWSLTNMDDSAKLISNEPRLYYYSGRQVPYDRFNGGVIDHRKLNSTFLAENDYVLLRLKQGHREFDEFINSEGTEKIKEFCNPKGECAAVFRLIR